MMMAWPEFPSLARVILGCLLLYTLRYVHQQLTVGASRRRLIKEHGCKPIKPQPGLNNFPHSVFGWKLFRTEMRSYKAHKFLETGRNRFKQYRARTLNLRLLHVNVICTMDPENLKAIMATNFNDFNFSDRRKSALVSLLGPGIFSTDGVAWQHSRELLRPNFNRAQVADLETFEFHVSHLIQAIPRDGSTVDLQQLFFRLTMDTATEFLFGESTNCLAPGTSTEANRQFTDAFNRAKERVGLAIRVPWSSLFFGSRFKADVTLVHSFVDRFVKRGLEYRRTHDLEKSEEGRYVFLHELAKRTDDPVRIRSELLNILAAGADTTASLLGNVFFALARNPRVWEKLRVEVDSLRGNPPTYEQMKNMKYLRAVLNECKLGALFYRAILTGPALRMHPIIPGNGRMAVVDTVLPRGGGPDGQSPILVPKKEVVIWSVYSMHRCEDFYGEDAEEFKPERWETARPGWEYLPFNG